MNKQSWDDEEDGVVDALALALPFIAKCYEKVPRRTSKLTGAQYYQELLTTQNSNRFYEAARMDKDTFLTLLTELQATGLLTSSRTIEVGDNVMILLRVLMGKSGAEAQERWQHSGETIHRVLRETTSAVLRIQHRYINQSSETNQPVSSNLKFLPYFQHCVGAVDGTHIPVTVPESMSTPYRNRKSFISQNVMAACDFNMVFCYVLVVWEGSAHDGHVLRDSYSKGFATFDVKYYLGDAGYPLTRNMLTPFRGVRYHLKEWSKGVSKPRTKEELFNLRHSSLRNVIEKAFGSLKKRFSILQSVPAYEISFQNDLILSAFVLHNFIQVHQTQQSWFDFPLSEDECADENDVEDQVTSGDVEMESIRTDMAQQMWDDYIRFSGVEQ